MWRNADLKSMRQSDEYRRTIHTQHAQARIPKLQNDTKPFEPTSQAYNKQQ